MATVRSIFRSLLVFFFLAALLTAEVFAQPSLHASAALEQGVDLNRDGRTTPGDVVRYSASLVNDGLESGHGLTIEIVPDPNTTIIPGSLNVSPIAFDDVYAAFGNTLLSVSAPDGLLRNDRDPDGDALSVAGGQLDSAAGGEVVLLSDGSFTYLPPVGFSGDDSFVYEAVDSRGLRGEGSVTINVGRRIWYVDSARPEDGDGRSNAPFRSLQPLNGPADADAPGDILYAFGTGGPYSVSMVLEDEQRLVGEGAELRIGSQVLRFAGPVPVLAGSGGPVVTFARGSSLEGFEITGFGAQNALQAAGVQDIGLAHVTVDGAFGGTGNALFASAVNGLRIEQCSFRRLGDNNPATTAANTETALLLLSASGAVIVNQSSFLDVGRDAIFIDNGGAGENSGENLALGVSSAVFERIADFALFAETAVGDQADIEIAETRFSGILNNTRRAISLALRGGANRLTIAGSSFENSATNNVFLLATQRAEVGVLLSGNDFGATSAEGVFLRSGGSLGSAPGSESAITALIEGNTFGADILREGVFADATADGAVINLTMRENIDLGAGDGLIALESDTAGSTVCGDIAANDSSSTPAYILINSGIFNLAGFGGGDGAAGADFVASQNPAGAATAFAFGLFGGTESCPLP